MVWEFHQEGQPTEHLKAQHKPLLIDLKASMTPLWESLKLTVIL